jgi:hypothetical protein
MPDEGRDPELAPAYSEGGIEAASADERAAAYAILAGIENPTIDTPESVDCASCHLANRLRGYLDLRHPPATAPESRYVGQADAARVVGGAETNNDNLRAFGYFGVDPVVSQRTANETHAVLAALDG